MKILAIDDHESVLEGTVEALRRQYPEAAIVTASAASEAKKCVASDAPDLVVMDLSMPEAAGEATKTETGLQLLRTFMQDYPTLNIVVQSAHARALVRLKPAIDRHEGGLTVVDKSLPLREMLVKADWAMQGLMYTPRELRTGLEVKPEWLEMLALAFGSGLQDRAIAQEMNVSERTIRNYWTRLQDALGVYPEEGKNLRIQTEIRAREECLIE